MTTCDKCQKEFNLHDPHACLDCRNYGRYPESGAQYFLCPECNTWEERALTVKEIIQELQKYNPNWPVKIACYHHEDGHSVGHLVNIRKITNRSGDMWMTESEMVMLDEERRYTEETSEHK